MSCASIMSHRGELAKIAEKEVAMPIIKDNRQTRYGPPSDLSIPIPAKGSEVFVARLPKRCCERRLISLFEKAGRIYELRLLTYLDGTNRGYCFVRYYSPDEADHAICELNGFEICLGYRISVAKSFDNCRLFMKGVPKDKSIKEICAEMTRLTFGVVQIRDASCHAGHGRDRNRGIAVVEYESYRAAAVARHTLINGPSKPWGDAQIAVYWAEPEVENLVLLVSGFPPLVTNSALEDIFNVISGNGFNRMTRKGGIAYVHFHTHAHAVRARIGIRRIRIEGSELVARWREDPTDSQTSSQSQDQGSSNQFVIDHWDPRMAESIQVDAC